MIKTKKLTTYDLNPRFFKDSNGNGVGDLKGLISKFDYLPFLGIDTLIIQDFISIDSKDKKGSFIKVSKDIGGFKDLEKLVKKANKKGIKIFIEIKINSIKENNEWFGKAVEDSKNHNENIIDFSTDKDKFNSGVKYNEDAKAYFQFDEKTEEIPLNWNSKATHRKFTDVIRFWYKVGIDGFVFTDFENIDNSSKNSIMQPNTLIELRKLYVSIKEVNDSIVIVGKSSKISIKDSSKYTSGSNKVFDYFKTSKISLIGTHHKYGSDVKGKFSPMKLFRAIKMLGNKPTNIIQFGSNIIGRFISRWGNDRQYLSESAKSFAMLLMLNRASKGIYYSDELGARNIGLSHLDNFQDEGLSFRKDQLFQRKVSNEKIMDGQIHQNPINARSLMPWNESKNGGFSIAEKTITRVTEGYKNDNVEVQFNDSNSILHFYKKLISLINEETEIGEVVLNGNWKLSYGLSLPGVAKIVSKKGQKEITAYINLSDSSRTIIGVKKEGKVIISSYSGKFYQEIPNKLDAYESILITKNINVDDVIKEKTSTSSSVKLTKNKLNDETKKQMNNKIQNDNIDNKVIDELNEEDKNQFARVEALRMIDQEKKILKEKQIKVEQIEKEKILKKEIHEKLATDSNESNTSEYDLDQFKDFIKIENEVSKDLKDVNKNSIMKEQITSDDHTKLTEDQIASTTQIDIDEIDDLEEFLNKSK